MIEDDQDGNDLAQRPSVHQILKCLIPEVATLEPVRAVEAVVNKIGSEDQSVRSGLEQLALFIAIRKFLADKSATEDETEALVV